MITIMFTTLLVAFVAIVVLWPLWTRDADVMSDLGREEPASEAELRSRLARDVEAMRDLDYALVEGKMDEATYQSERKRLTSEAEVAVARMRRKRDEAQRILPGSARTYRVTGVAAACVMLASVISLVFYLNSHDVQRSVSPHASGQIPLTTSQFSNEKDPSPNASSSGAGKKSDGMVFGARGAPDPAAMVSRLEERIASGKPTAQDLAMLARSYRVLGREKEVLAMYRDAARRVPDDPDIQLMLGMSLFDSGTDENRIKATAAFDRVLELRPEMPEALWFKSLIHVQRHEIDPAKTILRKLQNLVTDNPDAKNAVAGLLAALDADLPPAAGAEPNTTKQTVPKTQ